MDFYLGAHTPSWLERTTVPLFVSRKRFGPRKEYRVTAPWAMDSGGFTELALHGGWTIGPAEYAAEVLRIRGRAPGMEWCAPQDWMCEPSMLQRTGLTVREHQRRTLDNFLELRPLLGTLVIPVLQGWELADYERHAEAYDRAGVDLRAEPRVGVGSVCRRQRGEEAAHIITTLARHGLRLHGFGLKLTGLPRMIDALASCDSLAWSFRARRSAPLPGHAHRTCSECLDFALRWRGRVLAIAGAPRQTRLAM